ncbi:MAG TPA: acyl-CoA dehydrogenase family protein [Ramlibacter sp.]|nr:acyl-CoA dehydrogenase family protein [Ramlibacter sp.]
MNSLPSDAAREIADHGLRWARERYPLATHRELARESDGVLAGSLWGEIRQLGWTGLLVPEAQGGLGASLTQACGVAHVCGASLLALPWLEHAVLAVTVLRQCAASSELAHAVDHRVAVALHPSTCTARQAAGGWRLSGEASAVEAPLGATRLLAAARLENDDALFVVESPAGGLHIQEGRGLDAHRIGRIRFDGLQLPPSALLATGHDARRAVQVGLDHAALAACAEAAALAGLALEHTLEHLRTRQQFGQPIGRFQALQHRAADLFVAARYAAAMAWGTIEQVDADPQADHSAAIAAAKAEVLRNARAVLAGATQLHGGMGVVDELPISHALKRVLALEARYGDRLHQLERVAQALAARDVSPSPA